MTHDTPSLPMCGKFYEYLSPKTQRQTPPKKEHRQSRGRRMSSTQNQSWARPDHTDLMDRLRGAAPPGSLRPAQSRQSAASARRRRLGGARRPGDQTRAASRTAPGIDAGAEARPALPTQRLRRRPAGPVAAGGDRFAAGLGASRVSAAVPRAPWAPFGWPPFGWAGGRLASGTGRRRDGRG